MSGKVSSVGFAFLIGVLAVACSAGAQPSPTPTGTPIAATPTPQPTAPPSARPTPTLSPTLPPLRSGSSKAGNYRVENVEPEIHVTLPAGWQLYFNDAGGAYMNTGGGELLLARPEQVIVPDTNDHEPAPEDLLAWFVDHPSLRVTEPTPVEIAGRDAAYVESDPTHKVDVFYDPLGNFHVGPGTGARFYVIPVDGPDILAVLLKNEGGEFDEALDVGVPIVESLEIGE